MAKPLRPNVNSGLDTSQNKAVSVAGYIVTSANIVGQFHEEKLMGRKISL
jgi:hypothetical protein